MFNGLSIPDDSISASISASSKGVDKIVIISIVHGISSVSYYLGTGIDRFVMNFFPHVKNNERLIITEIFSSHKNWDFEIVEG